LYVATESSDLVANFAFEAYDYGNRDEHHGKPECYAYDGYAHRRA
jgi:hypothetical protein